MTQLHNPRPHGSTLEAFLVVRDPVQREDARVADDISVSSESKSINIISKEGDRQFGFKYVLDQDRSHREIVDKALNSHYSAAIPSVLERLLGGENVTLMFLGSTTSQKRELFEQVVPLVCETLAGQLQAAGKRVGQNNGSLRYICAAQHIEVIEEIVQDLLKSDNRDLQIRIDPVRGVTVTGCTYGGPFTDIKELVGVFKRGTSARSSGQLDFGPASQFASCIFSVDITQVITVQGQIPMIRKSKLQFVEVPSTEILVAEGNGSGQQLSLQLKRSLVQFRNVIRSLSAGGDAADYANYDSSKLMQLLRDGLGGNAHTVAFPCVVKGSAQESMETLDLSEAMQRIQSYPVQQVQTVQGLLRRMRVNLSTKEDRIKDLVEGGGQSKQDEERISTLESNLEGMQEQAVRDKMAILKLREDNRAVFNKLQEFRKKYNELVGNKAKLQEVLIAAEQEKLKISKALVDLQIENNELVERSENDKYELVTKLLNAENEIMESERKEQKKMSNVDELKSKIIKLTKEKKDLAMEFITLKTNYMNVTKDLNKELSKNEELGVELLTLVNQKNAMESEQNAISLERDQLKKEHVKLTHEMSLMQGAMRDIEDKLNNEQELSERLRADKLRADMELSRLAIEAEKDKVVMDRNLTGIQRDRDTETMTLRKASEQEQKRFAEQKLAMQGKLKEYETSVRKLERAGVDMQKDQGQRMQEENRLKAENAALEHRIKSLTDNYRSKLLEYLNENNNADGEGEEQRKTMMADLTSNYQRAEEKRNREIKQLRKTAYELTYQKRTIFKEYMDMRHRCSDLDPKNAYALPPVPDEEQFTMTQSAQEQDWEQQITAAREKLRLTQQELNSANEKNVESAETFRKIIRNLEKQNADLNGDVKIMRQQREHLQKELELMAAAGGGGGQGGQNAVATMEQTRAIKQQQAMMETLMTQMQEIKSGGGAQQPSGGPSRVIEKEVADPKVVAENEKLKNQVSSLKEQLASASSGGGPAPSSSGGDGADSAELDRLKAENKSMKEQLAAKFEKFAGNYSDDPDKKMAELMTRNAVLETELENYQKYMKATTKK
jgi:coiled-coil domain-containing protein 78